MSLINSNCLVVAGEKSGEEHCLSFFDSLQGQLPSFSFWGVGGDSLKEKNLEILFHINDFSSMGFSEVFLKIPFYYRAMDKIIEEVKKRKTKTAILVDFQTFNLKLAEKLSSLGVKVLYYVAPQAWIWKEYRVEKIKKSVHTLFSILPFEKKWFLKRGVQNIELVEHPVFLKYKNILPEKKMISNELNNINLLVLPGSRYFELKELVPEYARAIKFLSLKYRINVRTVLSSNMSKHLNLIETLGSEKIYNDTELSDALKWANISLATSGTVTLASGLFQVPSIVCYKTSLLNEFIFHTFIKYKGLISLTNLIIGNEVFPELTQDRVSPYNIVQEFEKIICNKEVFNKKLRQLQDLRIKLDTSSFDVATFMAKLIKD